MSAAMFADVKNLKHRVECLETLVKELIDKLHTPGSAANAQARGKLTLPAKPKAA